MRGICQRGSDSTHQESNRPQEPQRFCSVSPRRFGFFDVRSCILSISPSFPSCSSLFPPLPLPSFSLSLSLSLFFPPPSIPLSALSYSCNGVVLLSLISTHLSLDFFFLFFSASFCHPLGCFLVPSWFLLTRRVVRTYYRFHSSPLHFPHPPPPASFMDLLSSP